ncbi:hypothetical protein IAW_05713 [Bacillus cereus str. Schrouff]|nr:hypothetical protein IAW_05713 [Bacillus cereus str. Schrouff]EOO81565.1 hypothetical protein IGY_05791 [Bacillus cereus K-5975c]
MQSFGEMTIIKTGKAPVLIYAFKKLQKDGYYIHRKHSTIKHSNNFIEQGYRHIKHQFIKYAGFQNLRNVSHILNGIETVHTLYKQNEVCNSQTSSFRHIMNYNNYLELYKRYLLDSYCLF